MKGPDNAPGLFRYSLEKFEREFNEASSDLRAAVRSGQDTLGERSRLWRARGRLQLARQGTDPDLIFP